MKAQKGILRFELNRFSSMGRQCLKSLFIRVTRLICSSPESAALNQFFYF